MPSSTTLSKEIGRKPIPGDRAFYPLNDDIRNHVSKAKRALELSKYDQENLRLKVEEWKKTILSHISSFSHFVVILPIFLLNV